MDSTTLLQTPKELLKQRFRSLNPEFRYYKSLFNATSDLIAVTDGDKVIDANALFVQFFSAQGLDVFSPDFSLSSVFERIDKYGYVYDGYGMRRWYETILQKEKYHYRVAIVGADKLYDFNIAFRILEPADDVYVVTLTDVSEMMEYKSALEESFRSSIQHKEEAEYLLHQYDRAINASNLVSKSDLDGTIIYVNDAFCQALKYTREELIGDNILIFCVPDENDLCYDSIWKIIEQGNIWKGVLQNVDKEGDFHYFDTTIVPIKDQSGEVVEYLSVRHEITEMMKAKKEALQTLESKTKFFNQVSHELRTPLNAIVNFTDQALENFDDIFDDENSREMVKMFLERSYKNSQNLLYLINSLLDMAKMKSGKETFVLKEHDALILAREVYEDCSSLIQGRGIDYRFKSNISSLLIHCDAFKLRQILTNLISNAVKFTSSGFIEVRLEKNEEVCCIEVADSGIGIPEEKIATIFEPFQQAREYDAGTGLGLSIVKEYAHAMGFALDVRSKEGEGSRFTLTTKKFKTEGANEWIM